MFCRNRKALSTPFHEFPEAMALPNQFRMKPSIGVGRVDLTLGLAFADLVSEETYLPIAPGRRVGFEARFDGR